MSGNLVAHAGLLGVEEHRLYEDSAAAGPDRRRSRSRWEGGRSRGWHSSRAPERELERQLGLDGREAERSADRGEAPAVDWAGASRSRAEKCSGGEVLGSRGHSRGGGGSRRGCSRRRWGWASPCTMSRWDVDLGDCAPVHAEEVGSDAEETIARRMARRRRDGCSGGRSRIGAAGEADRPGDGRSIMRASMCGATDASPAPGSKWLILVERVELRSPPARQGSNRGQTGRQLRKRTQSGRPGP